MVSVWWLLVAFWIGGVLGLVLGAVAGRTPEGDAGPGSAPPRRLGRGPAAG